MLTLGISGCGLMSYRGLCRCSQVKMMPYGIRVDPNLMIDVLKRGKLGHRHTQEKAM